MLINGKAIAQNFNLETQKKIELIKHQRPPMLAFVLVGDNPASHLYVKLKTKKCEEVGIDHQGHKFTKDVTQNELLKLIEKLNLDPNVDGILVQMPLPPQINSQQILEAIDPKKDVDGFHPFNMGRLLMGFTPYFIPCTPLGIYEMLNSSHIEIAHKNVVIMGRSNIVGKPLAALLMQKNNRANATVTLVHSHTKDVEKHTLNADILIAAMGSPHYVKASMIKKEAVVIDVGINKHHGKLVGDVDFEAAKLFCSHITPVPGGVGPMTIAMLLSNTLRAYQFHARIC